jgi:hypothetical protein
MARNLIGIVLVVPLAFPAYVALHALGLSPWLCASLSTALMGGLAWQFTPRLLDVLDRYWRDSRVLVAVGLLLLLVAGWGVGRLTMFVANPAARTASVQPASDFMTRHSCFTAYYEAARTVSSVPNVYDPALYGFPPDFRFIDGFQLDAYEYPPQFLLLPRALLLLHDGFLSQRALWFFFQLLVLCVALFGMAAWIAEEESAVPALLAPTVLLAIPTRLTLQTGNFQIAALALSILGMLAFERKRPVLGAALLGFTSVAKLFPGVLLVYLLFRRRWRELGLTLVFVAAYTALSVGIFGIRPMVSFLSFQLPRLANGEAFPMLRIPWAVAANQSISGIVLKLGLLGVSGMSFALASVVRGAFTVAVFAIAARVGRVEQSRLQRGSVWLALLGLAALAGPFVPPEYGLIPALWLLTLLVGFRPRFWPAAAAGMAWIIVNYAQPLEESRRYGPPLAALTASIPQLVSVGLLVATLIICYRQKNQSSVATIPAFAKSA